MSLQSKFLFTNGYWGQETKALNFKDSVLLVSYLCHITERPSTYQ